MINLLLASSLVLFILYALYRLWFKSDAHWSYNRFVLLGCVFASLIIHLIPSFNVTGSQDIYHTVTAISEAENLSGISRGYEHLTDSLNTFQWIQFIYWFGALCLGVRLLTGLFSLLILYRQSTIIRKDGFQYAVLDREMSPNSFFNILLISKKDMEHPQLDTILVHEHCHRAKAHSFDRVLLEVMSVFFWFHPCIWLIRRELNECHEFEADRAVLKTGETPAVYKHLLFEMQTGHSLRLMHALSGNISLLKRYKMMNKQPAIQMKKLLPALGTFLIILVAGGFTFLKQQPDTLPKYQDGEKAMYESLLHNLQYPAEDRKNFHSGTVYVTVNIDQDGHISEMVSGQKSEHNYEELVVVGYVNEGLTDDSKGINESLESEVKRVIRMLGDFEPATLDGKPVECSMVFPVTFQLKTSGQD